MHRDPKLRNKLSSCVNKPALVTLFWLGGTTACVSVILQQWNHPVLLGFLPSCVRLSLYCSVRLTWVHSYASFCPSSKRDQQDNCTTHAHELRLPVVTRLFNPLHMFSIVKRHCQLYCNLLAAPTRVSPGSLDRNALEIAVVPPFHTTPLYDCLAKPTPPLPPVWICDRTRLMFRKLKMHSSHILCPWLFR